MPICILCTITTYHTFYIANAVTIWQNLIWHYKVFSKYFWRDIKTLL